MAQNRIPFILLLIVMSYKTCERWIIWLLLFIDPLFDPYIHSFLQTIGTIHPIWQKTQREYRIKINLKLMQATEMHSQVMQYANTTASLLEKGNITLKILQQN